MIEDFNIKKLIKKLLSLLHIHKYEIIKLCYEQPIQDYDDMFCDYKIEQCKCGKTKKVYISIYSGEYKYTQISNNLKALTLVNKRIIL